MVHPSEEGQITALAGATVHLAEELDQTRPLRLNAILRRTVLCLSGSALDDAPIPWILKWTACDPPFHLDPHNCKEDLCNHVVSFFSSSLPHHSQDGLHPPFSFPSKKEKTKKTNEMHFFVPFRFVRSRQCVFRFPSSIASRALRRLPRVVERGLERIRACGAKRSTVDDGQQRRRTGTAAGVGADGAWTRRTSHVVTMDVD